MPTVDLPLDQLRTYVSNALEPADFDAFWQDTVTAAQAFPLDAVFTPAENLLPVIDSFDASFSGFGGDRIKAWLHLPAGAGIADNPAGSRGAPGAGRLPVVVQFIGYSGGRGLVQQDTRWAQAGYAHLIMDTRGQGYGGILGETPDPHPSAGAVSYPGLMTRGLTSPEEYYYRRLYVDAFRAIEAAKAAPGVDPQRVVLAGMSQGGGLALAAAGLAAGRLDGIRAVLTDVPFLQDFTRALSLAARGPYAELVAFLARHRDRSAQALEVLNYFDGVHLARRATAPALYSVALLDDVCPASTVFASYNSYGTGAATGPETVPAKSIEVYPFNNHEGGDEHQWVRQLHYLRELFTTN